MEKRKMTKEQIIQMIDEEIDCYLDERCQKGYKTHPTRKTKKMYGKTYMGTARKTFLIDENRVITDIIEKVKTKEHTNQILGE